jgi:flagellar motor switch protein FliN/FliY
MAPPAEQDATSWVMEAWTASLGNDLETVTGVRPKVSWTGPAAQPAKLKEGLWWEQPLSLAADATVWVGAPAETWREVGGHLLRASGVEAAEDADARSAYLEVLGMSLAGLAGSMGDRLGGEVTCGQGREVAGPPEECAPLEASLSFGGALLLPLAVVLADRVRWALQPSGADQQVVAAMSAPPPAQPNQPPRTLELLMEVELPVSVSFGRAELPLKDVLKLTTGSIVELNRTVQEPVELIVNNCVIARGEVVVVDGNYGVRIQHIISPQERLRTLK